LDAEHTDAALGSQELCATDHAHPPVIEPGGQIVDGCASDAAQAGASRVPYAFPDIIGQRRWVDD